MAKPSKIREVRYTSGTTFLTAYTAANDASWAAGTANKLRVQACDMGGLEYKGLEDASLQTSMWAKPPNIPSLRVGDIKLSMFAPSGSANTTADPIATLMSLIMGGLSNPATKTLSAAAGSTTTTVECVGHGILAGQAVLLGTRGDGRGDGEVRIVTSVTTDDFTIGMATRQALSASDAIVVGHSTYLDDSTSQQYLSLLIIGADTGDQVQALNAMGGFKLKGVNPGELLSLDMDLKVADWQLVTANPASLSTAAYLGNHPPADRGLGGFFINDVGTTTRVAMKLGSIDIDPGLIYAPVNDPTGLNGIGSWIKMPSHPKLSFNAIFAEGMPGLYGDFANTTQVAKHVVFQWGCSAQRCFAASLPRLWIDESPGWTDMNGLQGAKVVAHGDENTVVTTKLLGSPIVFHSF